MENLEKLLDFIREQAKLGYVPSFVLLYNAVADDNALLYTPGTDDPLAKAILEFCKQATTVDSAIVVPGTGGPTTVQ